MIRDKLNGEIEITMTVLIDGEKYGRAVRCDPGDPGEVQQVVRRLLRGLEITMARRVAVAREEARGVT